MSRLGFSTIACPRWTLERIAEMAARWQYHGVELRTFGYGSTEIACDPALTATVKTRRTFADAGVEIASLATSLQFDQPVRPRIIGRVIGDQERPVREAKRLIDLAAQLECPVLRVFAFEAQAGEPRSAAVTRIEEKLGKALDHAHRTGVRLAIENGGSWTTAAGIGEIVRKIGSPLLGVSYSMAVAHQAGEDVVAGALGLGDSMLLARIKDLSSGTPAPIGRGELPCQRFAAALASLPKTWLIVEWDRLWIPEIASAEDVLPDAARTIAKWQGDAPARPRADAQLTA